MKINGTHIPTVFIIPAIMFVFWLGGLSFTVYANDEAQKLSEQKVEQATLNVATMQRDIENIKATLIRREQQERQDKQEILAAIRAND